MSKEIIYCLSLGNNDNVYVSIILAMQEKILRIEGTARKQ